MAIGISGFFDDDNDCFTDDYEDIHAIGIAGSDIREYLKEKDEEYDKDCSISGCHT